MIAHTNRGRLVVALGDGWRLYASTIPPGSSAIGIVSRDGTHLDVGALIVTRAGIYAQLNAGAVRSLPQAKVSAAVAAARSRVDAPAV